MTDKKPNHDYGFRRDNRLSKPGGYRCVFCKRFFLTIHDLNPHEASCPLRYTKKMEWAGDIERAKRKEYKRKLEDRDGGEER